jgi:hypothetical protein
MTTSPIASGALHPTAQRGTSATAWNLVAATVCASVAVFLAIYLWFASNIGWDLSLILQAARDALAGHSLYSDPTGAAFNAESRNFYGPPALALAYVPLSVLPDAIAVRVAFVFAYAATVTSLALLVRPIRGSIGAPAWASLLIGVALSYAVLGAANLGNPSILVLVGVALAFVGLERDRPWLVGVGLGTAIALRLYPVLLLIPLLIARRYRAVAASLVVAAAWGVAAALVFGIDDTVRYARLASAILSPANPNTIVINDALPALAVRVQAPDVIVSLLRLISVALGCAGLVFGGWLLRDGHAERRLVGLGIAAAGMLLLPSTIWDHYLTVLFVLIVGVVAVTRRARWGLLGAGLLPTAVLGGFALVIMPAIAVAAVRAAPGDQRIGSGPDSNR